MKTLLRNPELKISCKHDGTWLHFKTKDGLCASIHLENKLGGTKTIVERAITQWTKEFAINPK